MRTRTVFLLAGEASGDLHAGALARELLRRPGLRVEGIGGEEMRRAGVRLLHSIEEFQVMGFVEVLRKVGFFRRILAEIGDRFRADPPDLFIPIDYPGLNLRLLAPASRARIPILYYISPQVWAWDPGRIRILARHVRKMAVVFPFEVPLYEKAGVDVTFVGHPLLERIPDPRSEPGPRHDPEGESRDRTTLSLGLLPGSRPQEIRHHVPLLLDVAGRLARPGVRFLLSAASSLPSALVEGVVERFSRDRGSVPAIEIVRGTARDTLARSDAALVASGTATLEGLLLGVPMVVYYRTAPLEYWIARRLVRVPHIGLVNLVAEERAVPERVQREADPEILAMDARRFLDDALLRATIRARLLSLRDRLGTPGASARTAELAMQLVDGRA